MYLVMTIEPDTFFLRSAINRYRLHQRAIPRKSGHYYAECDGRSRFDPKHGCVKCLRTRGRVLDELLAVYEEGKANSYKLQN